MILVLYFSLKLKFYNASIKQLICTYCTSYRSETQICSADFKKITTLSVQEAYSPVRNLF